MKKVASGSRIGLAFVLSVVVTGSVGLTVRSASADQGAKANTARAGSTITRHPVKMRQVRSIPSITDQEKQ